MLSIKKRIIYSWIFITGLSIFMVGITISKYIPQAVFLADYLSVPLGIGFLSVLFFIDKQYSLISTNRNIEIVELYVKTGNMSTVSKELNVHPEEVRRNILKFIKETLY